MKARTLNADSISSYHLRDKKSDSLLGSHSYDISFKIYEESCKVSDPLVVQLNTLQ